MTDNFIPIFSSFWKRKLAAFLHDSPTKALNIRTHEARADAANERAGTSNTEFGKTADWTSAAADRIPFPNYRTSNLSCSFNGVNNAFRHPLGGKNTTYQFAKAFASSAQGEETEQVTQPLVVSPQDWSDSDKDRAAFFATWRLWQDFATQRDARFAFLPADTRMPDHTIWNHCALTAAFSSCGTSPALLRFQLGPVQDFIAAARITRDLWSGSYLISWLMTVGLKKLSALTGPDAVIFPNLHGQPVFDFLWKADLWSHLTVDGRTELAQIEHSDSALIISNLPNVFLALVPNDSARAIAQAVETAIREEWKMIADAVWDFAIRDGAENADRARFDAQITRHLSITWQTTPFPVTLDDAEKLVNVLPDKDLLLSRFRLIRKTFEQDMPFDHRDRRFYANDSKTKLNNIGLAWPLVVAYNQWQLDAIRNTRVFAGSPVKQEDSGLSKDALTGVEEQVLFVSPDKRVNVESDLTTAAAKFFTHADPVGALTLVKRLWHLAYLRDRYGMAEKLFNMPNTYDIAQHCGNDPTKNSTIEDDKNTSDEGKYFAVLAFDGDDMGKWVSGEKAPPFRTQLADYQDETGSQKGSLAYFQRIHADEFLSTPRLLTPSYHLQFSQSLSNFSLYAAPRVIAAYDGRLIYAGGDDVLAMLPADKTIACADDLQRVFRGLAPTINCGIRGEHHGFLSFDRWGLFPDITDRSGKPVPFLMPGPRTTASCGIAIAHFKQPLQDVVRTAQAAEKRAKSKWAQEKLKHSFALTINKRSGEITEWSARFDTEDAEETPAHRQAIPAFLAITLAMKNEILSSKFPYKMLEFIEPYRSRKSPISTVSDCPTFPVKEAVLADLATVMERQRGPQYSQSGATNVATALKTYLANLPNSPDAVLESLTGLFTVAAFLNRQ